MRSRKWMLSLRDGCDRLPAGWVRAHAGAEVPHPRQRGVLKCACWPHTSHSAHVTHVRRFAASHLDASTRRSTEQAILFSKQSLEDVAGGIAGASDMAPFLNADDVELISIQRKAFDTPQTLSQRAHSGTDSLLFSRPTVPLYVGIRCSAHVGSVRFPPLPWTCSLTYWYTVYRYVRWMDVQKSGRFASNRVILQRCHVKCRETHSAWPLTIAFIQTRFQIPSGQFHVLVTLLRRSSLRSTQTGWSTHGEMHYIYLIDA